MDAHSMQARKLANRIGVGLRTCSRPAFAPNMHPVAPGDSRAHFKSQQEWDDASQLVLGGPHADLVALIESNETSVAQKTAARIWLGNTYNTLLALGQTSDACTTSTLELEQCLKRYDDEVWHCFKSETGCGVDFFLSGSLLAPLFLCGGAVKPSEDYIKAVWHKLAALCKSSDNVVAYSKAYHTELISGVPVLAYFSLLMGRRKAPRTRP